MKGFRGLVLLFYFLVSGGILHAEEKKQPSEIPWYRQDMLESPFALQTNFVDTTHTGFQQYDFFSPGNPLVARKGNVGHAARLLGFKPDFDALFPLFLSEPYQQYRFQHNHIRYVRPEHVFTDLFYVTGANREQLFYGLHSQRFQEKFYVSGKYRIINSPGEYSRMGARNSSVYLSFDYQDPSERYQLLGSVITNRFENHESGGLRNHSAFEENPVRDSVFMYNAVSRYRETAIHLNHFYRTGFYVTDASVSNRSPDLPYDEDTDDPDDPEAAVSPTEEYDRRFVNLGRINHHFSYQRRSFVFEEKNPPSNFYQNTALESSFTFDSTYMHTIENQISWSNFPMQQDHAGFPFNFKVSLTHRFVNIQQPLYEGSSEQDEGNGQYLLSEQKFNQLVPGISIDSDQSRFLSFDGYTRMIIGGYNDEDLDIGGNLYLGRAGTNSRFQASVLLSQKEAPYFSSRFSSNYIRWDHDFEKMNIFRLSTNFQHKWVSLHASYYLLKNAVFMNSIAVPEQNTEAFSVITAGLTSQIGMGIFKTRHSILLQHTGSEEFERFPPLVGYHSVFADLALFKNAMFAQIGFDILYNSPYKPMAYMPVIMHFYSQDAYESNFDIYLDAFFTAKIKRTRFFLKLQNIMGLLASVPPAYPIPFHPLPEAAFKFGLSWMFFD